MDLMDTQSAAHWLIDASRALLHIKRGLIGRLQLTTMLPDGIRSRWSAGDGNRDMSFTEPSINFVLNHLNVGYVASLLSIILWSKASIITSILPCFDSKL